jgi:putative ATP-dependent endonuclease of OLD family
VKIVRLRIRNFRCIKFTEIFPVKHNVLLGPNNTGKTAVLEGLNLLLNPEGSGRWAVVDENDFFSREYAHVASGQPTPAPQPSLAPIDPAAQPVSPPQTAPVPPTAPAPPNTPNQGQVGVANAGVISIEAVLSDLNSQDEDVFGDHLIPWKPDSHTIVENTPEGVDPFENAASAIRVMFEGKYDPEEDDFTSRTFFLTNEVLKPDECPDFNKRHKRHIGFLIYRDFRGLTRPITLEPNTLFGRLLNSHELVTKQFEDVIQELDGALGPITSEPEFASLLNSYKAELERFLSLSLVDPAALSFELTDSTRCQIKEAAQLYVRDECSLPLQKMGAGTRSLAILGILTLIMRRRQRGILALEEPETFLFPHAQRRVMDECLELADQTFVTTHSPYVLERVAAEGVGRLERKEHGEISWHPLSFSNVKHLNLYSKRLRQSFCEALLGKAVIVVEGDSDRWWLYGGSRIMNRHQWVGRTQEALELQGIAVVSTDTNGDLGKTGKFFHEAGLTVVCVVDEVKDNELITELCSMPFSVLFLKYSGLEALLSIELSLDLLRTTLITAPHSRVPLLDATAVAAMSEAQTRNEFAKFMIGNKGSGHLHEWLLSHLDEHKLPPTLKNILDKVSSLLHGSDAIKVALL